MASQDVNAHDMAAVRERLDQIAKAVDDEGISLDDALALYEEAVKLGMRASELIEAQITGIDSDGEDGAGSAPAAPAQPDSGEGGRA